MEIIIILPYIGPVNEINRIQIIKLNKMMKNKIIGESHPLTNSIITHRILFIINRHLAHKKEKHISLYQYKHQLLLLPYLHVLQSLSLV